jgi:hypothetical protein
VRLDEPATYVVRVTNGGPDLAQAVQLAQTFAGRARVLSVSTSQGTCTIHPVVRCSLGDIPLGATATVRIRLVPLAPGAVKGATAVLGATADMRRVNNRTTAALKVRVRPAHVRLAVRPSARRARPGQRLRLVVIARDRGPGKVVGMQVCTRLPAGLIFVRSPHAVFRGGQVCWPREDVRLHGRTRHAIQVQVSPAARRGRLVATAGVEGANARRVRVRAGVQVAGEPAGRSGGVTG